METLIRKLRLTQDYGHTTVGADYAKEMLAAGHALAMNAKNLLDTVDQARIATANQADSNTATTMMTMMVTTTTTAVGGDDGEADDGARAAATMAATTTKTTSTAATALRIDED